jgi:hypothetical protein
VVAAASIVMALQTVVARNVPPLHTGIVTVGAFLAGDAPNVIPGTAELRLTVRVMQPSVRFPFRAPHSIRTLFKGSTQMCRGLRVVGCVIPELGAHVLIKLLSASGAELGECVVSLSHLVRLDAKKQHRCEVSKIPVTSGSKEVGEAKGIFTLTFLASVTEEHAPAAPNPDVESGSVNPLFGRDLRTATVASTSSNSSASHAEGR